MSLQAAAATRPGLGLAFGIHVAASRVCGCGNPGDSMVATVAATHIRIDERSVAEARLSWERRVVALFCSKMNTSPAMLHDTIRYDTIRCATVVRVRSIASSISATFFWQPFVFILL